MRLQLLQTHLSQLGSKYITFNNRILEGEQKKKVFVVRPLIHAMLRIYWNYIAGVEKVRNK